MCVDTFLMVWQRHEFNLSLRESGQYSVSVFVYLTHYLSLSLSLSLSPMFK